MWGCSNSVSRGTSSQRLGNSQPPLLSRPAHASPLLRVGVLQRDEVADVAKVVAALLGINHHSVLRMWEWGSRACVSNHERPSEVQHIPCAKCDHSREAQRSAWLSTSTGWRCQGSAWQSTVIRRWKQRQSQMEQSAGLRSPNNVLTQHVAPRKQQRYRQTRLTHPACILAAQTPAQCLSHRQKVNDGAVALLGLAWCVCQRHLLDRSCSLCGRALQCQPP